MLVQMIPYGGQTCMRAVDWQVGVLTVLAAGRFGVSNARQAAGSVWGIKREMPSSAAMQTCHNTDIGHY